MITWSGFNWDVRDQGLTAPGPNRWSDQNAVVSGTELVLSVAQVSGNWCCAEVACQSHLGYGIYRWVVNTRLDNLDVNDVLGMFTYAGPAPSFNEIDIEAAHWGNAAWPGGSGTIWQSAAANARVYGEFDWTDDPPYTCQFEWEPGRVSYLITDNLGATLFDWSLADGDIADAGFSDDFATGSVPNFAKWRRFGAIPPTLLSGQLRLQSAAAGVEYAGVATARTYDLVGCVCTVKPTPAPVSGAHELSLEIVKADDSERISLAISGTWLYHGVSTALVEDRAYSSTGDAWWRVAESGGTTTFSTSPDGTTWTVLGTTPTPAWMDDANVQIVAGHWGAEAADTDARIDNFTLVTTGTAGGALIPVPSTEKPYINYWRNLGTTPPAAKSIRFASFSWIPVGGVGLQSSQGHAAGALALSAPTVSGPVPFDPTGWSRTDLVLWDPPSAITAHANDTLLLSRAWSPPYSVDGAMNILVKFESLVASGAVRFELIVHNANTEDFPEWQWMKLSYDSTTGQIGAQYFDDTEHVVAEIAYNPDSSPWLQITATPGEGGAGGWVEDPSLWTTSDEFGPDHLDYTPERGLFLPDNFGGLADTPEEWASGDPAMVRSRNYRDEQIAAIPTTLSRWLTEDATGITVPDSEGGVTGTTVGAIRKQAGNIGRFWKTPPGNSYNFGSAETGVSGAGGTNRGDWNFSTAYVVNDIVRNNGNVWIATASNTGEMPTKELGISFRGSATIELDTDWTSVTTTSGDPGIPERGNSGRYLTFSLATPGMVIINSRPVTTWDTYAWLFDASGRLIAEDNNSAGLSHPRIGPLSLPAGRYYVGYSAWYGGSYGTSELRLEFSGGATLGPPATEVELFWDQVAQPEGTVSFGDVYDFSGNAPFTVEFYNVTNDLVIGDLGPGERWYIIRKLNAAGTEGWAIWLEYWVNMYSNIYHRLVFARFGGGGSDALVYPHPYPPRYGHFLFSYDGAQLIGNVGGYNTMYTIPSTRSIANHSEPLTLGGDYRGKIQDVILYSHGSTTTQASEQIYWDDDEYEPYTWGHTIESLDLTDIRIVAKWNSGDLSTGAGDEIIGLKLKQSADKQKFLLVHIFADTEGESLGIGMYPTDYTQNWYWDDFYPEEDDPDYANSSLTGIFEDPDLGPYGTVYLYEPDYDCAVLPFTDYWLVAEVVGNVITLEHWRTDPELGGSPNTGGTVTMQAPTADDPGSLIDWRPILGAGVSGSAGIGWCEPAYGAGFKEFRVWDLSGGTAEEVLPGGAGAGAGSAKWETSANGTSFTEVAEEPWPHTTDLVSVELNLEIIDPADTARIHWVYLADDVIFDVRGSAPLLLPLPPEPPVPGPIYVPRPAPEFEPLSHYKFELARSSDLGRIGELTQARGRSLQLALNRAGAFSCTLPLDDELTNYVQEVTTSIIISRDSEIEWSGPIWTITESVSAGAASLQIGAVGWLQTLDKRVVRASWNNNLAVSYVNQDAGVIALDLLARSNSDAMAAGAPVFIFPGDIEMTQPRTRSYQPWSGILGALTELTEIESGFDMAVDPVTRKLNISTRIGTDKGIIFELPGDVTQVNRQTDSGRILNFFTAYSSAGSATEVDADSVSRLGLFEEAQSLSDVVNPNILLAFAAGEIFVKSRPLRIVTFQPLAESIERPFSPRVFRDFNIGDIVRLSMHHGRMSMDRQPLRMFSFTVSFPETGGAHVGDIQTTMS